MKLLLLLSVTSLLLVPTPAPAQVSRLSPADRRRLESPAQVTLLRSMREVPASVVQACASGALGHEFAVADPGEPYQETDLVASPARYLPWRRLRWAARLPAGFYVLHYEKGGYDHSSHVLLVKLSEGRGGAAKARLVWSAVPRGARFQDYQDYGRFVAALRAGQLDDDPAYIH